MNTQSLETVITQLQKIRREQGEEAFQHALKYFVKAGLRAGGQSEIFVVSLAKHFPFVDLDALRAEIQAGVVDPDIRQGPPPEPKPSVAASGSTAAAPGDVFAEALKQQLPGLKNKAQMNAFMASFEAYREVMNAILDGDPLKEGKAREALMTSFEVVRKATEISNMLKDVPEAAASKASDDFRSEPTQWGEYDVQRKLLSELEGLKQLHDLNDWYKTNRKRIDEVQTATLRNPLLDAIREKKMALSKDSP
jgi:hypothetical protein